MNKYYRSTAIVVSILSTILLLFITPTSAAIKKYKPHDVVDVFANKVGPYNNPHEIYQYYDLPYCVDDDPEHAWHGLGEVLAGDKKIKTQYEINFRDNVDWRVLCQKNIDQRAS
jgi:transmembrane 9 superfamily protein 1